MNTLSDLIENVQNDFGRTGMISLSIKGHLLKTRETSLNFGSTMVAYMCDSAASCSSMQN